MDHSNVLDLIFDSVWAITPSKLEAIYDLGDKIAAGGRGNAEDYGAIAHEAPYITDRGIGVIPVRGVMSRYVTPDMKMSPATSTDALQGAILDYASNPNVRGVVFKIDSPGGTVNGLSALTDAVNTLRATGKPTASVADGAMASAAYWFGASAEKVYATPDSIVGSIGTIASRVDASEALSRAGIKKHIFRSGKYKALGDSSEGISIEEVESMDSLLNNYLTLFVDHIASARNTSPEAIVELQGRVYGAQAALDINLIDAVKSLTDVLASVADTADKTDAQKATAQLSAVSTAYDSLHAEATAAATRADAAEAARATLATELATLKAADSTTKIDAAVTQLIVTDKKVKPADEADLRADLAENYDLTMKAYTRVEVGAAAPADAPVVLGADDAGKASSVVEDAKSKGIPVAASETARAIYADSGIQFVDATVATPVLVEARSL